LENGRTIVGVDGRLPPALEYEPSAPQPRQLTLECANDWARVSFPVAPRWAYLLPIVIGAVAGSMEFAAGIRLFSTFSSMTVIGGPSAQGAVAQRHIEAEILVPMGITVLGWWGFVAYSLWTYHRWGRVPCVLVASADVLTFTRLRWWRIRQRRWPADEILGIEFRTVKNLITKHTVADLYVRRKQCFRLRFRLYSLDPQLPRQIAEAIAQRLNRPLTFRPP
jgi:hypothetical protein